MHSRQRKTRSLHPPKKPNKPNLVLDQNQHSIRVLDFVDLQQFLLSEDLHWSFSPTDFLFLKCLIFVKYLKNQNISTLKNIIPLFIEESQVSLQGGLVDSFV